MHFHTSLHEGKHTCRELSIKTHAWAQDALMHVTHHIPKIEAGEVWPQELQGIGRFHELGAGCQRYTVGPWKQRLLVDIHGVPFHEPLQGTVGASIITHV